MRHAIPRKVHQWTTDADGRLRKAISIYGHDNWHLVACYVSEDATPSQCSQRFKTLDESIKRTNWSAEEDARLSAAVAAYGSSWVDVAANVPGRHSDQCRERWTEQLNPSINKSQWSEEEDKCLLDYMHEHKDASWKVISERLGNGRTQAMCRNRHAVLQKGMSPGPAMPTIKYSFSNVPPSSAALAPQQPNQFIFLEPVVSSDPRSHKRVQPRTRTTTTGDVIPSNPTTMPAAKKRKTQSRGVRSNQRSAAAQPDSTS